MIEQYKISGILDFKALKMIRHAIYCRLINNSLNDRINTNTNTFKPCFVNKIVIWCALLFT